MSLNPSASKLLGSPELKEGITYVEYMVSDTNGTNDAFHQYILDCVYEKDAIHAGDVLYTRPDGDVRTFCYPSDLPIFDRFLRLLIKHLHEIQAQNQS